MREAGRTALLLIVPGALIGFGWARIEQPAAPGREVLWVAVVGLVPALLPRLWMRLTAGLIGLLVVVHTALRVSVFDARPFDRSRSFFGPLGHHFASGIGAYYDVPLPFDRHGNVYMHGVMLVAVFFGCFTVGLAVAARKPALAAVLLLLWAAWPMTLLTGPGDLARGAFVLAGVLLMLVAVRPSPGNRIGLVLILAAGLVAASLGVSTSSAVAKGEFLNWQSWDFYNQPDTPVGVSYVWDMSLDGFSYPKKITTVFRVKGPKTPHYWRATILDSFYNGAWYEGEIPPVLPVSKNGRDVLTADAFLPAAARNPKHWVKQEVTMAALRDNRLVAATTPVAYDKGDLDSVSYGEAGTARSATELTHDQSYTAWSYAPQPTPQQLEASKPIYPPGVQRFLELSPNTTAKPYGTPGGRRDLLAQAALDGDAADYLPIYRAAGRVAGDATSPYAATVAIEAWFRSNPAFTYNQHPHPDPAVPALVWFVTTGKTGYCQYYAGAMALMLRSLGIPARIDAGFTAGRYDPKKHVWTVTDHNAHMWVEAWFRGYGWLPFDPTPSRGTLGGSYSTASPAFDAAAAGLLAVARRLGLSGFDIKRSNDFGFDRNGTLGGLQADVPRKGGGGVAHALENPGRNASLLQLLALIALGALALLVVVKAGVRRARYLTRDPRRIATACRRELTDFLLDQRIAVERSATPHELSALVRTELGVDGGAFADAVSGARFGPPARAREAARQAREERRTILRTIRRRLPLTRRTIGLFSLRSLGMTR